MSSLRNLPRFAPEITSSPGNRGANATKKETVMTETTQTVDVKQVQPEQKAEKKGDSGEASTVAEEIRGTLKSLHAATKDLEERVARVEARIKKMGW